MDDRDVITLTLFVCEGGRKIATTTVTTPEGTATYMIMGGVEAAVTSTNRITDQILIFVTGIVVCATTEDKPNIHLSSQ